MPRNVNKDAYEQVIKGLKGIKSALKKCDNQEHFHSIVASYSSIDVQEKKVQNYINKHEKKRSALIKLEGKIAHYIIAARRLYGDSQPEPEVLVNKSEDKVINLDPEELARLETTSRSTDEVTEPASVEATKDASVDVPKSIPADATNNAPVDVPKPIPVEAINNAPVEVPKPIPVEATNNGPVEASKPVPVELPQTRDSTADRNAELLKREGQLRTFINTLNQLKLKRDEFHTRYPEDSSDDLTKVYGVTCQLVKTLEQYAEFYKDGTIDLAQFKTDSSQAIRDKRNGVLSEHRGYKEILANLLLAIGTLGIGYALAALFTQRFTPISFNTDSINKLNETQEAIDGLSMT